MQRTEVVSITILVDQHQGKEVGKAPCLAEGISHRLRTAFTKVRQGVDLTWDPAGGVSVVGISREGGCRSTTRVLMEEVAGVWREQKVIPWHSVIVEVEVSWELKQVIQGLIREAKGRRWCKI
jgi:hypothetical protein